MLFFQIGDPFGLLVGLLAIVLGILTFLKKDQWSRHLSDLKHSQKSDLISKIFQAHAKEKTPEMLQRENVVVAICFIIIGFIAVFLT